MNAARLGFGTDWREGFPRRTGVSALPWEGGRDAGGPRNFESALCHDRLDHLAFDVGEAVITSAVAEGEAFVIES